MRFYQTERLLDNHSLHWVDGWLDSGLDKTLIAFLTATSVLSRIFVENIYKSDFSGCPIG